MTVRIVPVSDLRRNTRQVIETAVAEEGVVYITQHGRPAVVLMDYERYEALVSYLEDLSDLVSLQQAVDEPARPYEEFLAELEASAGADDSGA